MAGGSASEEPLERGATHFLEHLLFKRTPRRSGAAVARITDRLGGDCDAYTTKECVSFHARVPAERAKEAVDLLVDLTSGPAFTAADVEVERGVILEEMAEAEDVPDDLLHESFLRRLWPAHALGAPILGTAATVKGLTHTRLVRRFRAIARPERTLVAAAGAFDPDRLVALFSRGRARRDGGSGSLRARGPEASRRPLRLSPRAAGPPADAPSRGRADDPVRPSSRPGRVDRDRGSRRRRLVPPVARRARAARPRVRRRDRPHAAPRGRRRSRLGRDTAEESRAPRRDDGPRPPALSRGGRHAVGAPAREEPVSRGGRALARVHGRAARERRAAPGCTGAVPTRPRNSSPTWTA